MAAALPTPRERRPSTGAPIHDLQGPVGPGFSRPKHKRTFTGFGAGEIKSVEGVFGPLFPFINSCFATSAVPLLYCGVADIGDNSVDPRTST